MRKPQTVDPTPVPIPTLGLNTRDPLTSMDPRYAPWILNWEPEPQALKARGGWHVHAIMPTGSVARKLSTYNNDELWVCVQPSLGDYGIFDVTTEGDYSAASPDHTATGSGTAYIKIGTAKYGSTKMAFCSGTSVLCEEYNGSTWTQWGFVDGAAADVVGYVSTTYKGRVYVADGRTLYYSGLEAVTGTCQEIDLSAYFKEKGEIFWLASLTSPGMRADETYLAIGHEKGEILVYGGDYPSASNWELVGRFTEVAPPANFNCALEYRNDVWIPTTQGVVSLRKLFTEGSESHEHYTVSAKMDDYWATLMGYHMQTFGAGSLFTSRTSPVFWANKNKVYIGVNSFVTLDGTATQTSNTIFAYNTLTGGWVPHKIPGPVYGLQDMAIMNEDLYMAAGRFVLKYDLSSYKDENSGDIGNYVSYDMELQGAYMNFGSSNKNKRISSFEPIINTDFDGSKVGMQSASDFGRKVSSKSNVNLQSGYSVPEYFTGVEGVYLQYRFDGESDTSSSTGYELYSVGINFAE